MQLLRWRSLVDFLVLTGAIYLLLRWAKQARAVRIALGIIGLYTGALVARDIDLPITSWVLSAAGFIAVAVLLVLFQPELRHAFMRLDTWMRSSWRTREVSTPVYDSVADAAFEMAATRTGALIVLARNDAIAELMQGSIAIGAQVSRELLVTIFQKTTPLHDGAVVIDGATLTRASAVLPLTQRADIPSYFGTRHRAAMGLAERSDAALIVVSEERGAVTFLQDGKIHEMQSRTELVRVLAHLDSGPEVTWSSRLRATVTHNIRLKIAALGLAAGLWAIALFVAGSSIRTVTVPIAFNGVPAGLNIASQSASVLSVQLRGNALLMDSAPMNRLAATFDLRGRHPGQHTLRVGGGNLDLPPGIHFERSSPPAFAVRLEPNTP